MAEISYKDTAVHIESCRKSGFSQIYFIYGEPYLRQRASSAIIEELLPDENSRSVSLDIVDTAEDDGVSDAVERVTTFSFFSGPRVVLLKAPGLMKDAREKSGQTQEGEGSSKTADSKTLQAAVKRGFPQNHYLIIAADGADKRTGLYKTLKNSGTVIDCSAPSGARKAGRDEQRQILWKLAKEVLARHKKTMDRGAFEQIFQRTGFDPAGFTTGLEKLVLFTGQREAITGEDVAAAMEQSREDPVYLFTGALTEKNADLTLYYLNSLLATGFHYMQLLSAMARQIRRLIAVKGFITSPEGGKWVRAMPYDRFRQQVMPLVVEYDKIFLEHVREMKENLHPDAAEKKTGPVTDLLIAANPKNPYPVYQAFLQTDRFGEKELFHALKVLHQADLNLKTTGRSPGSVLESAIIEICRAGSKS